MTQPDTKNTGIPVLRALDMLEALSGHVIQGLANKDLAAALDCPPAYVSRAAEVLISKGWVERDATTGRFRITPAFSLMALRTLADFDRAKAELERLQRKYTLDQ